MCAQRGALPTQMFALGSSHDGSSSVAALIATTVGAAAFEANTGDPHFAQN